MVDHLMHIFIRQVAVRLERIGVNIRSGFDVFTNRTIKTTATAILYHMDSHFAVTFEQSHDSDFAITTRAFDLLLAFVLVHESRFAADESSSTSTWPDSFSNVRACMASLIL